MGDWEKSLGVKTPGFWCKWVGYRDCPGTLVHLSQNQPGLRPGLLWDDPEGG